MCANKLCLLNDYFQKIILRILSKKTEISFLPYSILYIKIMQIMLKQYHCHQQLVSYCLFIKFVRLKILRKVIFFLRFIIIKKLLYQLMQNIKWRKILSFFMLHWQLGTPEKRDPGPRTPRRRPRGGTPRQDPRRGIPRSGTPGTWDPDTKDPGTETPGHEAPAPRIPEPGPPQPTPATAIQNPKSRTPRTELATQVPSTPTRTTEWINPHCEANFDNKKLRYLSRKLRCSSRWTKTFTKIFWHST